MSVRITIDDARLRALIQQTPGRADDLVAAAAFEGERIVKTSFGSGSRGRTYRRAGRSHTASVPGSPPAVDTGKLRAGIYVYKPAMFRRIISTGDTQYAAALEFGTRNISPRPYMTPMARQLERIFPELMERLIR